MADRLLLFVLLAIGSSCRSPRDVTAETQLQKISASVIEGVRAQGEINVIVALAEPLTDGRPIEDHAFRRAQIARMQREVLSTLSQDDYRSRVLFENVPAMAGTILRERALRMLDAHAYVVKVDPDPAGGGIR